MAPVTSGKSANKKPRGKSNPGIAEVIEGPLSSTYTTILCPKTKQQQT